MVNDVLPFALIRKQCASGMYRRKRAGGTPHALRVCAGLCECECVNVRICTYMREMFNIFLFVPGPYPAVGLAYQHMLNPPPPVCVHASPSCLCVCARACSRARACLYAPVVGACPPGVRGAWNQPWRRRLRSPAGRRRRARRAHTFWAGSSRFPRGSVSRCFSRAHPNPKP
jgi:hypothetical protein